MIAYLARNLALVVILIVCAGIALMGIPVAIVSSKLLGALMFFGGLGTIYGLLKYDDKVFLKNIAETNERIGLNLVRAFGGNGACLAIDEGARKLARFYRNGKEHELFDFDEIEDWQARWTEVSNNGSLSFRDAHLTFRTRSMEIPIFSVPAPDRKTAESWSQRLRTMMH